MSFRIFPNRFPDHLSHYRIVFVRRFAMRRLPAIASNGSCQRQPPAWCGCATKSSRRLPALYPQLCGAAQINALREGDENNGAVFLKASALRNHKSQVMLLTTFVRRLNIRKKTRAAA
jgi:hypothetical protein